jgi:hypothetical protein
LGEKGTSVPFTYLDSKYKDRTDVPFLLRFENILVTDAIASLLLENFPDSVTLWHSVILSGDWIHLKPSLWITLEKEKKKEQA